MVPFILWLFFLGVIGGLQRSRRPTGSGKVRYVKRASSLNFRVKTNIYPEAGHSVEGGWRTGGEDTPARPVREKQQQTEPTGDDWLMLKQPVQTQKNVAILSSSFFT